MRCFVGVDLSASAKRKSYYFIFGEKRDVGGFFELEELVEKLKGCEETYVAIDAPLTYKKPFRDCERELIKKFGAKLLPLSLKSMEMLYKRGVEAKRVFERVGAKVLETHPNTVERLYFSKKCRNVFGKKDLFDAFLCAIVAYSYWRGSYICVGNQIYLPKKEAVEEVLRLFPKIRECLKS